MKKSSILFILLLLIGNASYSDHFAGYDMALVNIKDGQGHPTDTYKLKVRYYRESTNTINIPLSFSLGVYSKTNNQEVKIIEIFKTNPTSYLNFGASDCFPSDASNYTELGVFESAAIDMSNLNDANGYYILSYPSCCRASAGNIQNGSSLSTTMRLDFPAIGNTSPLRYNSTPEFNTIPRVRFCVERLSEVTWSASDVDGDSLVYSLDKPNHSSGSTYNYASPHFSITNPLGISSPFQINASNGNMVFKPGYLGSFILVMKVEEFRNGNKISTIKRDVNILSLLTCSNNAIYTEAVNYPGEKTIRDTILYNINHPYQINIKTNAVANDTIRFRIATNPNSQILYSSLDTNAVQWLQLDSQQNIIKTTKYSPSFVGTAHMQVQLNFKPNQPTHINNRLSFYAIAEGNSCFGENEDTISFELLIKGQDSVLFYKPIFTGNIGQTARTSIKINNPQNANYQWQCDYGFGFKDIANSSKYSGVQTDSLTIHNIQYYNHQQKYRCVINSTFNPSISPTSLLVVDTCLNNIVQYNYVYIPDTLQIRLFTGNSLNNKSALLKIYPNPSHDYLYIDLFDDYIESAYTIHITNPNGQLIYEHKIADKLSKIKVGEWGVPGNYLISILNKEHQIIESRKITIQ